MLTAKSLVGESVTLYSLPDVYFQIREMVNDSRFSAKDIGKVIAKDPALSMRLLKIVNSSFYGFPSRIDTISRAVMIVGIGELQNLVLATSVLDTFEDIPSDLVNMTDFWIESVYCGVIAKLLAKKSNVLHSERLFLAGLLHDIGALVLYVKQPEKCRVILQQGRLSIKNLAELELSMFGFTRADVGAEIADLWGLPESLSDAIRYQLMPEKSIAHKLDAHLLYLAVNLANLALAESSLQEILAQAPETMFSLLRFTAAEIDSLMLQATEEFSATFDLLAPGKQFH